MAENDIVADFLAREQNEMAGLSLEDDGIIGQQEREQEQEQEQELEQQDFSHTNGFEEFEELSSDQNVGNLNTDGMDQFNGFGESNGYPEEADQDDLPAMMIQHEKPAPNYNPQMPKIEPEKIRKWREEHRERLENKDAQEAKDKERLREQAKKELAEWYKSRAEQHDKVMNNNRVHEAEFVKERDAEVPGQEWERIARLCEFNPKKSNSTKDMSRMRSMLLQLKQQPKAKTPA